MAQLGDETMYSMRNEDLRTDPVREAKRVRRELKKFKGLPVAGYFPYAEDPDTENMPLNIAGPVKDIFFASIGPALKGLPDAVKTRVALGDLADDPDLAALLVAPPAKAKAGPKLRVRATKVPGAQLA